MIERVEGLEQPLQAGGLRQLTIWTTAREAEVEIICFVDPPRGNPGQSGASESRV